MAGHEPRQRIRAVVTGTVQGVGFRWFVQRAGTRLGLDGWVANRPDRTVEVVAEGPTPAIEELLTALRSGPPSSVVQGVEVRRLAARGGLGSFSIRSGSHPGD